MSWIPQQVDEAETALNNVLDMVLNDGEQNNDGNDIDNAQQWVTDDSEMEDKEDC